LKRRFALRTLALATLAGLSACGFRLRGATSLDFDSIFIEGAAGSSLVQDLKRQVSSLSVNGPATRVLPSIEGAKVVLKLIRELREKEITGITASGKQRDYQLRLRVIYQAFNANLEPITSETELVLRRDISTLDSQLSSKQEEDVLLYREMQNDMVQQLISRISAFKPSNKKL
jgi:LPS-assembly lipoprotein